MRERYGYIDVAKTVAIVMVCSYHFALFGDAIQFSSTGGVLLSIAGIRRLAWGISVACVPLFFMASGALVLTNPTFTLQKWIRSIRNLLLGYIAWRLITFTILELWQGTLLDEGWRAYLSSIFLNGPSTVDRSYMWFIPVYACFLVVSPLFKLAFSRAEESSAFKNYLIVLLCILLLIHFALGDINSIMRFFPLFSGIDITGLYEFSLFTTPVGMMLGYSLFGAMLHLNRNVVSTSGGWLFGCMIIAGMVWLWLRWGIESTLAGANWDSVFNGYYSLGGVMVTVGLFGLFMKLEPVWRKMPKPWCKIIRAISVSTLEIYYIHWIVGYTVFGFASAWLIRVSVVAPVMATYLKGIALTLLSLGIATLLRHIPLIRHLVRS